MGYRNFALGSVAASLIIAAACYPVPAAAQAAPDLDTLTAAQAAADICSGKITSTALTSAAIARATLLVVPSDWPEITTRLPGYIGAMWLQTASTSARSCSSLSIWPLLLPKPR